MKSKEPRKVERMECDIGRESRWGERPPEIENTRGAYHDIYQALNLTLLPEVNCKFPWFCKDRPPGTAV